MSYKQQIASDPAHSSWVQASAGTGKTKILTDRVLRLLLKGIEFNKILCITFTKAIANEMIERIIQKMQFWSYCEQIELKNSLASLLNKEPNIEEIRKARSLFLHYLQKNEQLNIKTIHNFCNEILQKFPLEAEINPDFAILDDFQKNDVINKIQATLNLNHEISESLLYFASNKHEQNISEIISEIINHQHRFSELFLKYKTIDLYRAFLLQYLNLATDDESKLIKAFFYKIDWCFIEQKIHEAKVNDYDHNVLLKIIHYRNNLEAFSTNIDEFFYLFLTLDGKKKKKIFSSLTVKNVPELQEYFLSLQAQVCNLKEKLNSCKLLQSTLHLYKLALVVIKEYHDRKLYLNNLDFDDLIYYTNKLLSKSVMRHWVLYKLDYNIRHILIDEAQDNSIEQWNIILVILEDFLSGLDTEKLDYSFFAVGDIKQSIYSFQGADAALFGALGKVLYDRFKLLSKSFELVNLDISYRSTQAILDVAHQVFQAFKDKFLAFKDENLELLSCYRTNDYGKVELWPLFKSVSADTSYFWPISDNSNKPLDSASMLANEIAHYIHKAVSEKKYLAAVKRETRFKDFLILVRTRDKFVNKLLIELQKLRIPVAGSDRFLLKEHISILDLLSVAKFVLMPNDNLNLAALLKSPFMQISEQDLYFICIDRKGKTIWDYLNSENNLIQNCSAILAKLLFFIDLKDTLGVYDFFYNLLETFNYRSILNTENGNSDFIFTEFLNLVYKFTLSYDHSLQNFVTWFDHNNIEVKAQISEKSDNVKIMTVHAAKGLQSPVVILADTASTALTHKGFIWVEDKNHFVYPLSSSHNNSKTWSLINDINEESYHEYLRLLYVALTRSEDKLIICGYASNNRISENCWYQVINKAIKTLGKEKDCNFMQWQTSEVKVVHEKGVLLKNHNQEIEKQYLCSITDFSYLPDNISYSKNKNLSNSIKAELMISPLNRYSQNYGKICHQILDDVVKNRDIDLVFNHPLLSEFTPNQTTKIQNIFSILAKNPEFHNLIFSYKCRSEVSIIFSEDEQITRLYRIDLLAIKDNQVIIIDYKTDSAVPKDTSGISEGYIKQLLSYQNIVKIAYPDKQVSAKILWLEDCSFMDVF